MFGIFPKNSGLRYPFTYENPLCAQTSPSFFFIDDDDDDTIPESMKQGSYNEALSICKTCSHVSECAEWGIRYEAHGFWGGLSPNQRRLIRKNRKITLNGDV